MFDFKKFLGKKALTIYKEMFRRGYVECGTIYNEADGTTTMHYTKVRNIAFTFDSKMRAINCRTY